MEFLYISWWYNKKFSLLKPKDYMIKSIYLEFTWDCCFDVKSEMTEKHYSSTSPAVKESHVSEMTHQFPYKKKYSMAGICGAFFIDSSMLRHVNQELENVLFLCSSHFSHYVTTFRSRPNQLREFISPPGCPWLQGGMVAAAAGGCGWESMRPLVHVTVAQKNREKTAAAHWAPSYFPWCSL